MDIQNPFHRISPFDSKMEFPGVIPLLAQWYLRPYLGQAPIPSRVRELVEQIGEKKGLILQEDQFGRGRARGNGNQEVIFR